MEPINRVLVQVSSLSHSGPLITNYSSFGRLYSKGTIVILFSRPVYLFYFSVLLSFSFTHLHFANLTFSCSRTTTHVVSHIDIQTPLPSSVTNTHTHFSQVCKHTFWVLQASALFQFAPQLIKLCHFGSCLEHFF